jgi:beta propeller repeat protein
MLPASAPDFGKLPLAFEPNAGQTDPSVRFLSRSAGGTLFFTPSEVVFSLSNAEFGVPELGEAQEPAEAGEVEAATAVIAPPSVVRLQLLGAEPGVGMSGGDVLPGRVNYYLGNDPSKWQSDLPTYDGILYSGLYPGVDLRYEGTGGSLKGTYVLAAGADPSRILWRYEGASSVQPDSEGNLQVRVPGVEGAPERVITEKAPVAWQEAGGKRVPVSSGYVVGQDGVIGFRLGSYDRGAALVLDPDIVYSSYLGGSNGEVGQGIAVDASGNIYVTGWTTSANFPTLNPHQPVNAGLHDGYVTKFDPTGSTLIFSTYLGGSAGDEPKKIAVDSLGNSVIAGGTYSPNFPTTPNAYQLTYGGDGDGIVANFGPTGSLLYSTYLGGSNYDDAFGARLVGAVAYLAGTTASPDFPVTLSAYQPNLAGNEDAFITKLPLAGGPPVYSTFLGGSLNDHGNAIAVDTSNNAYVTGGTMSTNFPVANAYQLNHAGGVWDVFVTKLNAAGTALAYSTYHGANGQDIGHGIAVNSAGNAFVTGEFSGLLGNAQAFATRFSVSGATLDYANLYGATTSYSIGASIAVDGADNAHLIGETTDAGFPIINAVQPIYAGGFYGDAFAMRLGPAGQTLYSTYLGGSSDEIGRDVAVSGSRAYLVGDTGSTDFSVEGSAFQQTNPIFQDSRTAFVTVIDSSLPVPVRAPLPISQAQNDQDAARMDGIYLVWQDTRNGDADIFAHNVAISQTFPVYIGPGDQRHPTVKGNLIAWEDNRNGNWDIYAVRITGPLSVTLPTPVSVAPGDQINPAAASKYLVWQSEALPLATAAATTTPAASPATPTPTNTVPPSPTPCSITTLLNEGFEAGTLGAFTNTVIITSTTTPVPTPGWASVASNPHSGTNSAFAPNPDKTTDSRLTTINNINIPSGVSTATLTFWHRFAFENLFDGGVLEVSTDGGATWVDADANIQQGGYNGTITVFTGCVTAGTPPPFPAGKRVWTNSMTTYAQVSVNLVPYAGNTIKFRFRLGTDCSVSSTGWNVDDVVVSYGTSGGCATVTGTPPTATPSTPTPQGFDHFDIVGVVITDTIGPPITMTMGGPPSTNANPDISLYTANDGSLDNVTVWQTLPLTPVAGPGDEGGSTRWGLQVLINFDESGTPMPVTLPTVTGGEQMDPSVSDRQIVWHEYYTPTATMGPGNNVLGGSTRWGMYLIYDATNLTTPFTIADDLKRPAYPRINSNQVVWQEFDTTPTPVGRMWAVKYTDVSDLTNIEMKVLVDLLEFPPHPDNSTGVIVWEQKEPELRGLAAGSDLNIYGNIGIASPTPASTGTPMTIITNTPTPLSATATSTTIATATACRVQFPDVPANNTFYSQIRCLACRGIMGGYSDGTFRPNNNITRGQLSKIVANAAGFNEPVSGQTFEDVPSNNTFYDFIERMAARGIIGGYPCGGAGEPCTSGKPYFRPNANATRGQISKIVSEAADINDPVSGQTYEDVPSNSTFYVWIERLTARGAMSGYPCGGTGEPCGSGNRPYFRPNNNATRGQTSKIVANTFFPGCQTPALR